MKIRKVTLLLVSCTILTGMALVGVIFELARTGAILRVKEKARYESFRLASELRQSSDDLTRMARTYAVTGNPIFEQWFWEILAIRNGEAPRPESYQGRIYWDLVLENNLRPRPSSGIRISLQQLMQQAGFTAEEFALLAEAQANSDALVNIENIAMHAMKGLFDDGSGNFRQQLLEDGTIRPPDQEMAIRILHDARYHREKERIMRPVDEFLVKLETRTNAEVRHYENRMQKLFTAAGILLLFGAVILVFWYRLSRYILRRLGGEPEDMVALAQSIAQGNLVHDFSQQTDSGSLYAAMREMAGTLAAQTRQIQSDLNELSNAIANISSTSVQLAASSTETSSSISEITATVEEVRQTARLARDRSKEVSDRARELETISNQGQQASQLASEGMNKIKEEMEGVANRIIDLSEKTQSISEIISTVNDIADQSNLLAVNASIEAAQAGEYGKGFTVVAEEVKNLADQSKEATRQIRQIIDDIQRATGSAVMATERGNKAVEAGLTLNSQAGDAIETLVESVAISAEVGNQIAASGEQQMVGIDQLATAMLSIKQATAQNTSGARQLETSALDLEALAKRLKEMGDRFKV